MNKNRRSRKHTGRHDCVYFTGKSYSVFTANAQIGRLSTGMQPPNTLLCLRVSAISICFIAESHLCAPKIQGQRIFSFPLQHWLLGRSAVVHCRCVDQACCTVDEAFYRTAVLAFLYDVMRP